MLGEGGILLFNTIYVRNTRDGVHRPGKSTATGNNLKKQYEAWKKTSVKEAKAETSSFEVVDWCISPATLFKCTENVHKYISEPGKYNMKEVYETYKIGYGTNLEIYHLIMDICKDTGLKCDLKKAVSINGNYMVYALVVYYPDKEGEGQYLYINPRCILSGMWNDEYNTLDLLQ